MTVEKLLSLLPAQRHKARLKPKRRGAYRQHPARNPDELLAYLRDHGIRTTAQLKKLRMTDKTCPTIQEYFRALGSWSAATEQVYGKPSILQSPPPNDPQYIMKCCLQLNIWSQRQYLAARRKAPDVVPSSRQVRRVWGGFENLFYAARKESAKEVLQRYMALEYRLGTIPTVTECRIYDIDLAPLKRILGGKAAIDALLLKRQRAHEFLRTG